ncbi:hypothetical protein VM1G_08279 [Cytospora mali]|uniref:Uncharacterized protein n=1 Tax=Cytospora mali TaxID=578113 RepID=A0A194W928_CYTMA|nr:hypothetical protein VM1G_08279 [Valsa mali]
MSSHQGRKDSQECFMQDGNDSIIKLLEDDPKAMDAVIHFFYHLDYPSDPSLMVHQDEPETNGSSGVNSVNGGHNHDDKPSSSLDDFLPISVSKSAMKQRKKRARRKSLPRGPLDPPGTVTEVITLPDGDTAENREEGAPLVQRPVTTNGSGYNHSPAETTTAEKDDFGLVFHAKVYHVSRKLGIDSLQALALQKLEGETKEQWDSGGFVKAASEISSLIAESELGEGQISGIILDVLCEHRELINKDGMENIIRGMNLGYDLVKQLTKRGLIAM